MTTFEQFNLPKSVQKAIDDYNNIWANDLVISDELKNYKYFNSSSKSPLRIG